MGVCATCIDAATVGAAVRRVEALASDPEPTVREAAAVALGRLASVRSRRVLGKLAKDTFDTGGKVCWQRDSEPEVVRAPNRPVAIAAREALVHITEAEADAGQAAGGAEEVGALLGPLRRNRNREKRKSTRQHATRAGLASMITRGPALRSLAPRVSLHPDPARRAPPSFEVQSEVRLTIEPQQRADMLLPAPDRRVARHDDRARVLRMGWTLTPLGGGYGRIDGVVYTTFIVITDQVTEAERDEYLRLFSHRPAKQGEATRWLGQWMRKTKMKQPDIEELPGYEALFAKTIAKIRAKELAAMPLEERLAGLAPEQRLAGLAPEQRLAGLPTEQLILALPMEVLQVSSPKSTCARFPARSRSRSRSGFGEPPTESTSTCSLGA